MAHSTVFTAEVTPEVSRANPSSIRGTSGTPRHTKDPVTVAPFRAWRGSRGIVAQSPKFHASVGIRPAGGSLAQRSSTLKDGSEERIRKKKIAPVTCVRNCVRFTTSAPIFSGERSGSKCFQAEASRRPASSHAYSGIPKRPRTEAACFF